MSINIFIHIYTYIIYIYYIYKKKIYTYLKDHNSQLSMKFFMSPEIAIPTPPEEESARAPWVFHMGAVDLHPIQ